jgi:hypothetical protein
MVGIGTYGNGGKLYLTKLLQFRQMIQYFNPKSMMGACLPGVNPIGLFAVA